MRLATPVIALAAITAVGASALPLAAGARTLIEDRGFRAAVPGSIQCGGPMDLELVTRDPALLDADTRDAQRVVDAALAAIRFKCPDVPELTVRGSLQDGARDAFVATASRSNAWILKPQRTFRLDVPGGGRADSGGVDTGQRAVANLEPGMSLDAARDALASGFSATPRLLDGERLVVEENGCRAGVDWRNPPAAARPGWRCLQAWFTREEEPRLYRVDYVEIVAGNRLEEATDRLVSRYGEPRAREGRTWWQDQPRAVHLGWGEEVVLNGNSRHELQAAVRPSAQMTMLELSLYEPALTRTVDREFQF